MATMYQGEGFTALPTPRRVAELIDTLQACWTESAFRAWLAETLAIRTNLPEPQLRRVEHERAKREALLAEQRRQAIVAARVAAIAEGRNHSPAQFSSGGAGSELALEVKRALQRHNIPASRFGREVANDPGFVADLERGREPRAKVKARVRAYNAALDMREAAHG